MELSVAIQNVKKQYKKSKYKNFAPPLEDRQESFFFLKKTQYILANYISYSYLE